jgi:hypothetical protein
LVLENVIVAGVTVFALALTVIAAAAYRRTGERSLLMLAAAFALFLAKGVALSLGLLLRLLFVPDLFVLSSAFDVAILALFFVYTLRR